MSIIDPAEFTSGKLTLAANRANHLGEFASRASMHSDLPKG